MPRRLSFETALREDVRSRIGGDMGDTEPVRHRALWAMAAFEYIFACFVLLPVLLCVQAVKSSLSPLLAAGEEEPLEGLAEGTSIGTVVFDAGYVINGDVADVVIAAQDGQLTRWTDNTVTPATAMDPTRRLAAVAPGSTTTLGADPGLADTAAILMAVEQVAAASRCLDLTVAYSKDRVQFGRPIGSFQALKHRMSDLYVKVSAARSIVNDALADPTPTNASLARYMATEAFNAVAGEAIQMHGGIAITWESDIQFYFKRAHGSAQLLGSSREHLRRLEADVLA